MLNEKCLELNIAISRKNYAVLKIAQQNLEK